MSTTREEEPAIAPFARRLEQLDPGLVRAISALGKQEGAGDSPAPWLDNQPAESGWLNDAGGRIYQACRESARGLEGEQLERLVEQVVAVLAYPVALELANLQDRAIILECTGGEDEGRSLQREVQTLCFSLEMAERSTAEGIKAGQPETMANGLGFMEYIRQRAERQVNGLPAHPEGEK